MIWSKALFIIVGAIICFLVGVWTGIKRNRVCLNDDNKECKSYFVDVGGKTKVAYVLNTKQINTFTYRVIFSELYNKEKVDDKYFEIKDDNKENE